MAVVMESPGDVGDPMTIRKPACPNRGSFPRQKLAQGASSSFVAATPSEASPQGRLLSAVRGLGPTAKRLCLLLAQQELESEALKDLGFLSVSSCQQFRQEAAAGKIPRASGMLVVSTGENMMPAVECCQALDEMSTGAASIVLLLLPDEEASETGELEMKYASTFLEGGADDVIILYGGETVRGQRIEEAIIRTEILARKASLLMARQVEAVKRKTSESLQGAWAQFMWDLPGKVLESIPAADAKLPEQVKEGVGIGDYNFTGLLGSGTFGAVYRAEHGKRGTVAVKCIGKESVKNIYQLFSINSEVSIMSNLSRHPNVLKAFGALHPPSHIVLVMEHGGARNLQSFFAEASKHKALSVEIIERFCRQAAVGVAHLHASLVCHRDLKPTNYVVSEDQSSLRITDFGLSVMSFGPQQKLMHCCGSLPFAAPEVLRLQQKKEPGQGYDGFAADVWSLAANFLEFSCGLYTMDRLLGWVPQPPGDPVQRQRDIENVKESWRQVPPVGIPWMQKVLTRMFVMPAHERCSIAEVVGGSGTRR